MTTKQLAASSRRSKSHGGERGTIRSRWAALANDTAWTVNVRFVLVSTAILLALLSAAFVWNRFQVRRMSSFLLERADEYAANENWTEAIKSIRQFQRVQPGNTAARIKYARMYDRQATSPREKARAIAIYDVAIGVAEGEQRAELLQRQTQLQLDVAPYDPRRYAVAERQAWKLLGLQPEDPESVDQLAKLTSRHDDAVRTLALSLLAQVEQSRGPSVVRAGEALKAALRLRPNDVELAVVASDVYRHRLDDPAKAEEIIVNLLRAVCGREITTEDTADEIAQLVQERLSAAGAGKAEESPPSPVAAVLAAYERLPNRDRFLDAALLAAPGDYQVRLSAGHRAITRLQGLDPAVDATQHDLHFAEAVRHLRKAMEIRPQEPQAYLTLAGLQASAGDVDEAATTLRTARVEQAVGTDDWQLNVALADLLTRELLVMVDRAVREQRLTEVVPILDAIRAEQKKLNRQLTVRQKIQRTVTFETLMARKLLVDGQPAQAVRELERIVKQQAAVGDSRNTTALVDNLTLLAAAYRRLGLWDRAAEQHERAIELQPANVGHRLAAGDARTTAGQYAAAARHYEFALFNFTTRQSEPAWAGAAWLMLAENRRRALVGTTAHLSPHKLREATAALEDSLQQAERANPNSWNVAMMRAQLAMAPLTGGPAESATAAIYLHEAETLAPESPEMWSWLASAYQELELTQDADRALSHLTQLSDDPLQLTLLKCRLLIARKHFDDALALLTSQLQSPPEGTTDSQLQALSVLREQTRVAKSNDPTLSVEQRTELQAEAIRALEALCHQDDPDISLLEQVISLYVQQQDWDRVETFEKRLRSVESREGTLWKYYRALRLLSQHGDAPAKDAIAEAKRLQSAIEKARPTWHGTYSLAGQIAQAEGRSAAAVEAFTRAVSLGNRDLAMFHELVRIHNRRGEYDLANRYVSQLQAAGSQLSRLTHEQVVTRVGLGDLESAVVDAQRLLQRNPDDPTSYIFLAQVQTAARQIDQAENTLQEGIRRLADEPALWDALISLLVQQERGEKAREVLADIEKNTGLTPKDRDFCLAKAHELLLNVDDARTHYQRVVEAQPQEEQVLTRYLQFLVRHGTGDSAKANDAGALLEAEFRRLLGRAPESVSARRALSTLLASRGDRTREELQEALALLSAGQNSAANRRLRAQLMWKSGSPEQQTKARQELELLLQESVVADPGDRLLLAEMLETHGQPQLARGEFLALVTGSQPKPIHVAAYINFLLRQGDASAARPWLNQLQSTSEQSIEYTSLRAQWLKNIGRAEEIEPLVDSFADVAIPPELDPTVTAGRHRRIAELYTNLGMYPQATRHLKQAFSLEPDNYSSLALSLSREGNATEAVKLCLRKKPRETPAALLTLALVLMVAPGDADAHDLAEPTLQQSLMERFGAEVSSDPQDIQVLTFIASVRHVQGRRKQASGIYRSILAANPHDVLAVNNLTTVLAEQEQTRPEARAMIEGAIKRWGETPGLLDTRGVVLLQQGEVEQAIEDLETASRQPNSDPRFRFHLAWAYDAAGQRGKATAALQKAIQDNLDQQILTPTERATLQELRRRLLLSQRTN